MPSRAYWKGRIRLSLVSIPVELFPATKSGNRLSFNQIHKPSGKRIRYEKVVPGIGPIDTDDIVKGYEVEKGKYVLLTDEDIAGVKLEAKRTIDLVQFVGQHEIDPIYFERPFFIAPQDDEDGQEAYVVLREALRKTKTTALGQIVVRGQSSIVSIKPCGDGLLLETLRYADELQKADKFFDDIPTKKADAEMITLAEELIGKKTKKFDPTVFKDSYNVALRELIEAKLEKRPPKEIEEPEIASNVINLMDALKRSLGKNKTEVKKAPKRAAKRASKSSRRSSKRKAA
jgi:DNA end-binding protein Ku